MRCTLERFGGAGRLRSGSLAAIFWSEALQNQLRLQVLVFVHQIRQDQDLLLNVDELVEVLAILQGDRRDRHEDRADGADRSGEHHDVAGTMLHCAPASG
jgi:hypothetical protein